MASRPALDAWYGARDWALEHLPTGGGGAEGWISRQDYEEKGGEYLSEHWASNTFVPMKLAKPARHTEASAATPTSAEASAESTLAPPCSAVAPADGSTVMS